MDTDAYGLPTGPVDHAPPSRSVSPATQEWILRTVLQEAGVEPGSYDERMLRWFADLTDWQTFATIASWVRRAADKG